MGRRPESAPLAEAISDIRWRILALAGRDDLSYGDRRAVLGTLGPFEFLQRKHDRDGRMLATPVGDREDVACHGC